MAKKRIKYSNVKESDFFFQDQFHESELVKEASDFLNSLTPQQFELIKYWQRSLEAQRTYDDDPDN